MQNGKQKEDLPPAEHDSQDLSKLFDYPSIGELFSTSDARRFDEFCARLSETRESLERVVRYGSREEATRATRAVKAVETTLEFLQSLQKLRQNK